MPIFFGIFISVDVKSIAPVNNDSVESTSSGNFQNRFFIVKFHILPSRARSQTRKARKARKSRKNFFKIFKFGFSILVVEQNRKLGHKKTRNNFSEISEISNISEFSICHFFIFQKKVFSRYSKV